MQSFLNPDRALQVVMGSLVRLKSIRDAVVGAPKETWRPGKPLKILLAGYVGTRNTGADVRVEEMVRQFRHILGDDRAQLTIMTIDAKKSEGYFRAVRQIHLPHVFPKFLYDECPKHHGVVACEGSMFKSKFAEALSTMMAGALGLASAENKVSVGYGAEAGVMSPGLQKFVKTHCRDSLVLCRNEPSRKILEKLGIRTRGGTDTAWTFQPAPLEKGRKLLKDAGWDGKTPILTLCPINPFWWPVKPDLLKFAARRLAGQYKEEHYQSIYFHEWSEEAKKKYRSYLRGLADAVNAFSATKKVFPVLVGMEMLDRKACEHLAEMLTVKPAIFVSDWYDMYDLVSVLRNSSYLVSSRFHAIVTTMPGLVPSAGVTMDERIRNLMNDRGHKDLFLEVDDPDLEPKLLAVLERLHKDSDAIREKIAKSIPKQLQLMGQMGVDFLDEVQRVYPEFPRRNLKRSFEHYLPPLPPEVENLMEMYG